MILIKNKAINVSENITVVKRKRIKKIQERSTSIKLNGMIVQGDDFIKTFINSQTV